MFAPFIRGLKLRFHARHAERLRAERLQRLLAEHPARPGMVFGRRQAGFTLIELLVSIAIVAILASAAAYAYSGYTNNAQISEATRMLDGAQTTVAAAYQSIGTAPGNAVEAGLNQNPGKFVASINVGGGGEVWAVFNDTNPNLNGLVLTSTPYTSSADPSAPLVWVCGYATPRAGWVALPPDAAGQANAAPAATTVPASYLPRSCRAGG